MSPTSYDTNGDGDMSLLASQIAPTMTFSEVLSLLYETRYTGPLTLHYAHGVPRTMDFPADPVRVRLDGERGEGVISASSHKVR